MATKTDQLKKMLEDRDMEVLFARVASNLLEKGSTEEAVSICETGIKKFPMYAQGHYVLARCYEQKEMTNQARTEYERAIKYDPNHLKAIQRLVELYQLNGMELQSKEKIAILQILNPFDEAVQKMAKSPGEIADAIQEMKIQDPKDPLNVDKVDLSQFDNTDDDFTTIIQGKQEKEAKPDEDEDVNLSLGTAAEDLATDTETNDRATYEEEIRLRKETDSEKSDQDNEYEDLDELQFDKDDSDHSAEENQEWAVAASDTDVTEILLEKNNSKKAEDPAPKKAAQDKVPDKDAGRDSEFKQPKIVTQTLGEILVSQKKYVEALRVFETLQEQNPDNKNIVKKVDFLKKIVVLEQK